MSKVFKTPIKPAVLISDPAGSEGDFYFNSVSKTLRFHDGTSWNDVASGANAAVSVLSDYPNNPSNDACSLTCQPIHDSRDVNGSINDFSNIVS